ncbi:MAG: TraV family lipoprotein [Deltaproteobacteria bacterium]|nr:TraV family lipoprotein [Deltaproteobacteria bacterium]
MRTLTAILLIIAQGCALNRAPSLNLLEKRADFDGINEIETSLQAVDNPLLVPVRTEPVVADIWVHPHELPNGDYFRGAWIRTVVTRSGWRVDDEPKPLLIGNEQKQKRKGHHEHE